MRLRQDDETRISMKTKPLIAMSHTYIYSLKGRIVKSLHRLALGGIGGSSPVPGRPLLSPSESQKLPRHRELEFATLGVSEEKGRRVWSIFYRI